MKLIYNQINIKLLFFRYLISRLKYYFNQKILPNKSNIYYIYKKALNIKKLDYYNSSNLSKQKCNFINLYLFLIIINNHSNKIQVFNQNMKFKKGKINYQNQFINLVFYK